MFCPLQIKQPYIYPFANWLVPSGPAAAAAATASAGRWPNDLHGRLLLPWEEEEEMKKELGGLLGRFNWNNCQNILILLRPQFITQTLDNKFPVIIHMPTPNDRLKEPTHTRINIPKRTRLL